MRPGTRILKSYSDPKYVVQVGDYHGVMLIDYTPDRKYETYLDLTLKGKQNHFITFFAKMEFNENYSSVESRFGYWDDSTIKVKQNVRNTPFYRVAETLRTFMPIRAELFIDLVKQTLRNEYKNEDEFLYYQIPDSEIKKYYDQDRDEEELISYDAINNYFFVCKSIFSCFVNRSETLIIGDYNFHKFPPILLSCSWLKEFELYELLISEIPEGLTNLRNLKTLSLKLKFLTSLPDSLHRLSNLEVMKIERTSITEIPNNLYELSGLRELYIINNEEIEFLSDQISKLKNLEYLYAYSNKLRKIPVNISRLEKLKVLHLAHNKIEEIPAELTALPELKVLNLKGNKLTGIPADLFEMESLEEVDLSDNPSLNPDDIYDIFMKSRRNDKINLIM